jgi:Putative auto-transporter adhesin, head GIN domain
MRPLLTAISLAACLTPLAGCAVIVASNDDVQVRSVFSSNAVVGNGVMAHDVRQIGAVSGLEVNGPLEVNVRVGPATSLAVDADSNLLPLIRSEVSGGTLRLSIDGSVRSTNSLRVTYTTPSLTVLTASGSGRLTVNDLKGEALDFSKSGSGMTTLTGQVAALDLRHSGSGAINANGLRIGAARIEQSGSGRVGLGPVQGGELSLRLSGSGSLQASGAASMVSARTNGSGSIDLMSVSTEQADLASNGSGSISATVRRSVLAQTNGSGRITVYGNPAQRQLTGKNVTVLN